MKNIRLATGLIGVLALTTGCATQNNHTASSDVSALQSELERAQTEADQLREQLAAADAGAAGASTGANDLLPPNAKPGHCYARVLIPARYESGTERVLARAASEKIEVVPARYEYAQERVMVQEASSRLEVIPATYKTVTERIMTEPEKTVLKEVPAEFETTTEKILVKPAYTTWKKGRGPIERMNASTGEIMCLVEVPAEYKTVKKRVVKTPARTVEQVIPAKYETVERRVVAEPSRTREVSIPAKYETVKVRKLVSAASTRTVDIPAEYKTVPTRKLVSDSSLQWREILCETNTTAGVVSRLQRALNGAGYDAGQVDGILGNQTLAAVKKYQKANNMPSGQLTMQVLDKLEVTL